MPTIVTKTVGPTGDYANLAAWITGEARDLVALNQVARAVCQDFDDVRDGTLVLSGFTTDATRRVEIIAENTHDGTSAAGAYRMTGTNTGTFLEIAAAHTLIRGVRIVFNNSATTAQRIGFRVRNTGNGTIIENCGIYQINAAGGGDSGHGILINGQVGSTFYVRNCVVEGFWKTSSIGFVHDTDVNTAEYTAHVHNCTFKHATRASGVVNLKNCISATFGSGFNGAGSTNNAAADASAPGDAAIQNATFTFEDAAAYNFRLASGDTSGAINGGANLSADANLPVTEDTVLTARPQGAAYDIGAFELPGAGGLTPAKISTGAANTIATSLATQFSSGTIELRTGASPGVNVAATGTLLGTGNIPVSAFSAATGGAISLSSPLAITVGTTGTVGYVRLISGDGLKWYDLTVGEQITLAVTELVAGGTLTIDTLTITQGLS